MLIKYPSLSLSLALCLALFNFAHNKKRKKEEKKVKKGDYERIDFTMNFELYVRGKEGRERVKPPLPSQKKARQTPAKMSDE